MLKTSRHERVALLTLHRPKSLNALCNALMSELNSALSLIQADASIGCVVITGSERAFAAGADIKEMATQSFMSAYGSDMLAHWHQVTGVRKPIIAAVNGYALGGGCELALMCDIILCGDAAKFGQPEVTIGTIPGCGGSQRLTRAVGKSKAMEMILTGCQVGAEEAVRTGLASRVVPAGELVAEAVKMGNVIGGFSQPIVALAKEAVNAAYESGLHQGVIHERRLFHSTFATVSAGAATHSHTRADADAHGTSSLSLTCAAAGVCCAGAAAAVSDVRRTRRRA